MFWHGKIVSKSSKTENIMSYKWYHRYGNICSIKWPTLAEAINFAKPTPRLLYRKMSLFLDRATVFGLKSAKIAVIYSPWQTLS